MTLPYTDDFSGATGALGLMSDGQLTWGAAGGSYESGTWQKASGVAYSSTNDGRIMVNAGVADNIVLTTVFSHDSGPGTPASSQGIVFRGSSAGDFYRAAFYYGTLYLEKWTSGSGSVVTSQSGLAPVAGDSFSVELSGTTATIRLNATALLGGPYSVPDYTANTHHGLAVTESSASRHFTSFTIAATGGGSAWGAQMNHTWCRLVR